VGFFEQILTGQGFWTEPVTDDGSLSPNRNWIPAVISEFLRAGTRTDKKAYDPALLPRTWSLTKILLKESDSEQEPSEGDALNKAINTSITPSRAASWSFFQADPATADSDSSMRVKAGP
jgi:hypothetical protein